MSDVRIDPAGDHDADDLAALISTAFADVAERFGLTRQTCPGHTAFLDGDEIRRGMGFGNRYFWTCGEVRCGAVAIRLPRNKLSILEKLAVLPAFRRRGIGRRLVERALGEAARAGAAAVEIGIIAAHTDLRAWYESLGFRAVRQAHYDHLPFDVLHMVKPL